MRPRTPEIAPEAPTVGTGEVALKRDVGGRRHQPADEVEDEKAQPPHAVFDVPAEDREVEHVADQVQPPAVQEHRDQRGEDVDRVVVDDARHPRADRHGVAERSQVGELARHHAKVADGRGQCCRVDPGPLRRGSRRPR